MTKTRTEEVRKGFDKLNHSCMVTNDEIISQTLGEIAITLAMMYDLMKKRDDASAIADDLK